MSNLEFAWPYAALMLLLIIPLWLFQKRQDEGYLVSPIALAMKRLALGKTHVIGRRFPFFLALIWALLTCALMRPQFVGEAIEISRDGRNIMLVVDLSESMEALDMALDEQKADRLTVAKDVLYDFINKRRSDRMGLVVFGSESFLHAPLTFDHATLKRFLSDAQIGFAGPKTAIGDALGLATKKLLDEPSGDRVIVMLTDGQNNIGSLEPMQAATIAQKHNVKIYVIGLGASSMVVDGFFGPQRINPSESLDDAEPEMRELTALTNGKYYRAKDHNGLLKIYDEIDRLEPVKADPIILIPRKELFYFPLALALALMVLKILFGFARSASPSRTYQVTP